MTTNQNQPTAPAYAFDRPVTTLTLQHAIPNTYLASILSTASYQGIAYWCFWSDTQRERYTQPGKKPDALFDTYTVALLGICDVEKVGRCEDELPEVRFDPDQFHPGFEANRTATDITLDIVARGVQRLFEPGVLPGRGDIRAEILHELSEGETGSSMDAEAADVIVQLGLFGEVIYG